MLILCYKEPSSVTSQWSLSGETMSWSLILKSSVYHMSVKLLVCAIPPISSFRMFPHWCKSMSHDPKCYQNIVRGTIGVVAWENKRTPLFLLLYFKYSLKWIKFFAIQLRYCCWRANFYVGAFLSKQCPTSRENHSSEYLIFAAFISQTVSDCQCFILNKHMSSPWVVSHSI